MMPTPGDNKVAATLAGVNAILVEFSPLIGIGFTTARMLIELLKRQGVDVGPFEVEIAKFDAARAGLGAAIADFHTKFPEFTPVPTPTPGPTTGPAPGESTTIGE